jgi:hypothetical protein
MPLKIDPRDRCIVEHEPISPAIRPIQGHDQQIVPKARVAHDRDRVIAASVPALQLAEKTLRTVDALFSMLKGPAPPTPVSPSIRDG